MDKDVHQIPSVSSVQCKVCLCVQTDGVERDTHRETDRDRYRDVCLMVPSVLVGSGPPATFSASFDCHTDCIDTYAER